MKKIKILLLYPPEQSWPGTMVKPNGSLAYPYLGGALKSIGVDLFEDPIVGLGILLVICIISSLITNKVFIKLLSNPFFVSKNF